jgi:ABC-type antimicrobial peptide transport system permease subunit
MSKTSFPINDLLRRKLQTSIVIASLTACIASTIYLVLFGENMGFGISLVVKGKTTGGFALVFSRFILFVGSLIILVGILTISFMIFMLMSQRTSDIGLMKAAGCPNSLIFGYFTSELFIVAFVSCSLGTILGLIANFASINLLSISQKPINFWLVIAIFVLFFVFLLIFGVHPILKASKVEPVKAISPAYHFGVAKETKSKAFSKSFFTIKIASRSLFRRKSSSIRIAACLIAIFTLITVTIAGTAIAGQTTKNWVERAINENIVIIGHKDICQQYKLLLSKFFETNQELSIEYLKEKYFIPESLINQLNATPNILRIDARLILNVSVQEMPGYIIDHETNQYLVVGDHHVSESIVMGVKPEQVVNDWFIEGYSLKADCLDKAVIGDTLADKIFTRPLNQSIKLFDKILSISGICLDPFNNGDIVYIHLRTLQSLTKISAYNIVLLKIDSAAYVETVNQTRTLVKNVDKDFELLELNEILDKSLSFLDNVWSSLSLLPLFALVTASFCMIDYVMLSITEQQQEFGIFRLLGVKRRTIVKIVFLQNLMLLLLTFLPSIGIGLFITLFFLIPEPVISFFIIVQIGILLSFAFAAICAFSLLFSLKTLA